MSIKSTLNGFLLQMLRSLSSKTIIIIILNLSEYWQIFGYYLPQDQRIIINHVILILSYLPPALEQLDSSSYHQSLEKHPKVFAPKNQDRFHQTLAASVFPKVCLCWKLYSLVANYLAFRVASILDFQVQAVMTTLFYPVQQSWVVVFLNVCC